MNLAVHAMGVHTVQSESVDQTSPVRTKAATGVPTGTPPGVDCTRDLAKKARKRSLGPPAMEVVKRSVSHIVTLLFVQSEIAQQYLQTGLEVLQRNPYARIYTLV